MMASVPRSARPAHRPSAREAMLDAAEAHLSADGTLTLDSAARAAGVSKPGLMYHFPTQEQLLAAILDHMAARYERGMAAAVAELSRDAELPKREAPGPAVNSIFADAPATQRVLAYLDWACTAPLSASDLVIFADPRLRVSLTERWQEQIVRWFHVPAGTPADERARLLAVRLMADGIWFDRAAGLLETDDEQAAALHELAVGLLGGEA